LPKQNDDDAEEEEENEIEEGGGTQEEVEKKKWWEDVVGWVLRNGEQTEVGRAEHWTSLPSPRSKCVVLESNAPKAFLGADCKSGTTEKPRGRETRQAPVPTGAGEIEAKPNGVVRVLAKTGCWLSSPKSRVSIAPRPDCHQSLLVSSVITVNIGSSVITDEMGRVLFVNSRVGLSSE
jgi:hypothetical protein